MKIITGTKAQIEQYLSSAKEIVKSEAYGALNEDSKIGFYCIHPDKKAHVWSYQLMTALISAIPAECVIIEDFKPNAIQEPNSTQPS